MKKKAKDKESTAKIITGDRIRIEGSLQRHEVVKKVVNHFIETEHNKKGAGIKFEYPVENLADGTTLMIVRPGHKKNFDFKVKVESTFKLGQGKHEEVTQDVRQKMEEDQSKCEELFSAITELYHSSENDIDKIVERYKRLKEPFAKGADVDTFLKVLKWLFIMEDIVYWDNEGRAFLYNALNYIARETDSKRLEEALTSIKVRPQNLKRYIKKSGLEWVPSNG